MNQSEHPQKPSLKLHEAGLDEVKKNGDSIDDAEVESLRSQPYEFVSSDFEKAGHHAIEAIAKYFSNCRDQRVSPAESRQSIVDSLQGSLQENGVGIEAIVDEVSQQLFERSMAMSHPLYLGLINSSPWPAAVIGDLLVSAIDNNAGTSHQGPFAFGCEEEVLRSLREQLKIPHHGLIVPGGSAGNLHGLLLARNEKFPEWSEQGPQALERLPRVYYPESSHFSVQRSALASGLGHQSLVPIDVVERGEIDVDALQQQIELDLDRDYEPFAVSLNVGSTGTGAIDNLDAASAVARKHDLWIHVDACYGGGALTLPAIRDRYNTLAEADSITVDLHKWFFMPITAAVAFAKDARAIANAFEVNASYIPAVGVVEPFQRGISTSRRGTSIAVWMALRSEGWSQVRNAVQRNIDLTRRLEQQLESHGFQILTGGELSICCARWISESSQSFGMDSFQDEIAERTRGAGIAWFATTRHQDETWLRMNMVNLYTSEADVDRLAVELAKIAKQLESEALESK